MGACINQKPKPKGTHKKSNNAGEQVTKSKIGLNKSTDIDKKQNDHQKDSNGHKSTNIRGRRKLNGEQFCATYKVQENVGSTSRAQGPKFITNFSDGSSRVLRILPFGSIYSEETPGMEKRIRMYTQICGLEIMEDQENYYSGPTIDALPQDQIEQFLLEVYDIISKFHQNNITLGNLNIFSFRQSSQFDTTVKLTDINFMGGFEQAMGHAHKNDREMDWQAFGYFVQLTLSNDPPIFIPHKLQYMQAVNPIVNQFLKGKKVPRQKLQGLPYIIANESTVAGYRFRNDVGKLLKLRKRRVQHREIYYPLQVMDENKHKLTQQLTHRVETQRIFARLGQYADLIDKKSEEAFMMYADASDKFKRLKPTFVEHDKQNKLNQLKEALPLLK